MEASEEDLRMLFRFNVSQKRRSSMRYLGSGGDGGGFINAMQFSSLWRVLTEEKGNLYREMQMFKYFDVQGAGVLTEDDFVEGWAKLVDTSTKLQYVDDDTLAVSTLRDATLALTSKYDGHKLMRRIHNIISGKK
jgi:hypothetical protein